eukprot:1597308-Amphidinium_carterae.1
MTITIYKIDVVNFWLCGISVHYKDRCSAWQVAFYIDPFGWIIEACCGARGTTHLRCAAP